MILSMMTHTTTTTRRVPTVHNPTNFEPRDYEVQGYYDNKRPVYYGQGAENFSLEVTAWESELRFAFGDDWRSKIHHCAHCGNGTVRWITAVKHMPSGDVIVFGAVCTKRLGFVDKHEFKLAQLQSRDEARKVRIGIWKAREAFLDARPELRAAVACIDHPEHAKNVFAKDVLRKLDQYGSLSEKQVAAVLQSVQRDIERAKEAAVAVTVVKGDAPSGRVTVTGNVLSTKIVEREFGSTLKMLVQLDNNSRVWCTVPSGSNVERNNRVTFTATFEVSKDDKSFAFGKRPVMVNVA